MSLFLGSVLIFFVYLSTLAPKAYNLEYNFILRLDVREQVLYFVFIQERLGYFFRSPLTFLNKFLQHHFLWRGLAFTFIPIDICMPYSNFTFYLILEYRNTIDFYILTLYPKTSINSPINFNNLSWVIFDNLCTQS